MTRSPLTHTAAPTCLLEAPGDTRTSLFTHVTCPTCREDGLRKGRGTLEHFSGSLLTKRAKKGKPR